MKKLFLINVFGIVFTSMNCFGVIYTVSNQYSCPESVENRSTTYNVYQPTPVRNGFKSTQNDVTYKSETHGNTTYHTIQPINQRNGYSK